MKLHLNNRPNCMVVQACVVAPAGDGDGGGDGGDAPDSPAPLRDAEAENRGGNDGENRDRSGDQNRAGNDGENRDRSGDQTAPEMTVKTATEAATKPARVTVSASAASGIGAA